MDLPYIAQVYTFLTSLTTTCANPFANALAKIFNYVFNSVMGLKLLISSPLTESFFINITAPRVTALRILPFCCHRV